MARKLKTEKGRAAYSRRKAIVEPVFGQIDTVQNGRRLLLRGRQAARDQWRFTCAVHNLLKLYRAGGLDLIRPQSTAPAGAPNAKRHPLATLAAATRSISARPRRSAGDGAVWSASPAVTAPGS